MFKKLLAAVGVGGAEVETELLTAGVQPGGVVSGVIRLRGGKVPQEIPGVLVEFVTRVEHEGKDSEVDLMRGFGRTRVAGEVNLPPEKVVEFPFELVAPLETPITFYDNRHLRGTQVSVRTILEISGAIDATDTDPIGVGALPAQHTILAAIEGLGFRLHSADVEAGHLRGVRNQTLPFYQEIEFHGSSRYPRLKQLEVTFVADQHGMDVILEGDKKAGLITSGRDLVNLLRVDNAQVDQVNWAAELDGRLTSMGSGGWL